MGESHIWDCKQKLMSQALRKLTAFTNKSNCTVVFINQLREKIGVTFGNPETTTGGRALKFYASVRIDIRKADVIKVNNELVGNRTKVKIAKIKLRLRSKLRNLILCTEKEYQEREILSI